MGDRNSAHLIGQHLYARRSIGDGPCGCSSFRIEKRQAFKGDFVAHSYGTFHLTWIIKYAPRICGQVVNHLRLSIYPTNVRSLGLQELFITEPTKAGCRLRDTVNTSSTADQSSCTRSYGGGSGGSRMFSSFYSVPLNIKLQFSSPSLDVK